MKRDGGQRARIHERHTTAIVELEDHSRESRYGVARHPHLPIARHSEMDDHRVTGREREKLVLPPALDIGDARASHPSRRSRRQMLALRAVEDRHVLDRSSDHGSPQRPRGVLDLG